MKGWAGSTHWHTVLGQGEGGRSLRGGAHCFTFCLWGVKSSKGHDRGQQVSLWVEIQCPAEVVGHRRNAGWRRGHWKGSEVRTALALCHLGEHVWANTVCCSSCSAAGGAAALLHLQQPQVCGELLQHTVEMLPGEAVDHLLSSSRESNCFN